MFPGVLVAGCERGLLEETALGGGVPHQPRTPRHIGDEDRWRSVSTSRAKAASSISSPGALSGG